MSKRLRSRGSRAKHWRGAPAICLLSPALPVRGSWVRSIHVERARKTEKRKRAVKDDETPKSENGPNGPVSGSEKSNDKPKAKRAQRARLGSKLGAEKPHRERLLAIRRRSSIRSRTSTSRWDS